jgi:predicted transcriptional regulator
VDVKTTVEVNDSLMERVRELAHREGRTFKSVLEEALHRLLIEHRDRTFHWEDCSVGAGGLREEWRERGLREVIEDVRNRS